MAPLSRGRAGFRARGGQRGHGRGRGRAGLATGARKSSTFYSTRVEQAADRYVLNFSANSEYLLNWTSGTEESSASEVGNEEVHEESDGDTSSDEDGTNRATARPYNVLLQSLKAAPDLSPPVRKKRRVEWERSISHEIEEGSTSHINGNRDNKEATDAVDEPEEENSPKAESSDEEAEGEGVEDGTISALLYI